MLGSLLIDLTCEVCGGGLFFNHEATFNAYKESSDLTSLNVFDKVEEVINKYFIFICPNCNIEYRHTYKNIENNLRISIFKQLLLSLIQKQVVEFNSNKISFLIYCGKCSGFDGSGSCPKNVFENCTIKKFPAR